MFVCTIPKCCSTQFIFVVLKVRWVCDQNLWHQFVKANILEDLIAYMKGGPNCVDIIECM
jgi:hypothetical protein